MPLRLSETLMKKRGNSSPDSRIRVYEEDFRLARDGALEDYGGSNRQISDTYYDVVTDYYEYGWGKSFHFAPRVQGESFEESLVRHERFLAQAMELRPGMVVADFGCGVGGPLMEIARFSGAKIVGVNSNAYQLERARESVLDAGLAHLVDFMHCDFLDVDAPDESFDAIYDIEAICHAPDKVSAFREAFRLLKPDGVFGGYEYCVTDRFDSQDPHHLKIKADIQQGGSLLVIDDQQTIDDALRTVGLEILETRDLAVQTGPSIPWYEPLVGSGIALAAFRSSRVGRWATQNLIRTLEALRIAPRGSVRVAETLNLCADAMVEAGRLGIFTPMYFVHARKPA